MYTLLKIHSISVLFRRSLCLNALQQSQFIKPYIGEDKPSIHDSVRHLCKPSCELFIALANIKYIAQQNASSRTKRTSIMERSDLSLCLGKIRNLLNGELPVAFVRYSTAKAYSDIRLDGVLPAVFC